MEIFYNLKFLHQLYKKTKAVLKNEKEEKMWHDIDWNFMSEESDGDDGVIVRHKLPWRSQSMYGIKSV